MSTETLSELRQVVEAYIECALWAGLDISRDDGGNSPPLDENFDRDDVSEAAYEAIVRDCADFLAFVDPADLEGIESAQVGHDFYLTRNRHGAGFWDRGLGDAGDRLTTAAHAYGTSELYPGDDSLLYVS